MNTSFPQSSLSLRVFTGDGHVPDQKQKIRAYLLFLVSVGTLVFYIYAAFMTKVLDPALDLPLQSFFRNDYYYCFLAPLTLLPTYLFLYLTFLSKKLFEHN